MELPRIETSMTQAKIGIEQSFSTLEMKQPQAEVQLKQAQPEMEIKKTKAKLTIDQSEAFAQYDVKNILRRIKEWSTKGKQENLETIAQNASEGNQLMQIENGRNAIADISAKKNELIDNKEVNIGFLPNTPNLIKFNFDPGKIEINIKTHKAVVEMKPNKPIIKFHPGDTKIYMRQMPSIEFKAVGAMVDQKF